MSDKINSETQLKCNFEKAIIIKKIPFWLYWISIGLIIFISGQILIKFYGDKNYLITNIIFCGGISVIPIAHILLFRNFRKVLYPLIGLLWQNDDLQFHTWITKHEVRIFTLKTWPAKIVTFFVALSAVITVNFLDYPYNSLIINLFALFMFLIFSLFCGQIGYFSISLLVALRKIVNRPINIPFFCLPHPSISKLQNYYSIATFIIILYYIAMTIAIWKGPYGLKPIMLVWLAILAFYPLAMFIWSYTQIHFLLRNIKDHYLLNINSIVNREYQNLVDNNNPNIDYLDKLMNIQVKTQQLKEWPFSIEGAFTFIATVLVALTQLVISILKISKP